MAVTLWQQKQRNMKTITAELTEREYKLFQEIKKYYEKLHDGYLVTHVTDDEAIRYMIESKYIKIR